MTRSVPTTDRPTTVPARDLTIGQHIRWTGYPRPIDITAEVRHLLPYRDADRVERIAVTALRLDDAQPVTITVAADEPVTLATPEQIAEVGATQRREELVDALRSLCDDIARLRLPAPSGPMTDITLHVDSRDELERWAAYLGVSVDAANNSRLPRVRREGGPVEFWVFGDSEPAPVEFLTPEQWQERTGVRVLDRDGWSDGKSWDDPIWYPEWLRRMSASTVQQRTVAPVEPGVVAVDGAAMAEAVAVVNDQVAATPPDAVEYGQDDRCKCGFRAPELGPHPDCPVHGKPAALAALAAGSDGDQ